MKRRKTEKRKPVNGIDWATNPHVHCQKPVVASKLGTTVAQKRGQGGRDYTNCIHTFFNEATVLLH